MKKQSSKQQRTGRKVSENQIKGGGKEGFIHVTAPNPAKGRRRKKFDPIWKTFAGENLEAGRLEPKFQGQISREKM